LGSRRAVMAKAILEPLTSCMRIHNDDDAIYGDKFEFFVGVRYLTRTSVEVIGLKAEGDFGISHVRAIQRELANHGVTDWTFNRIKNGEVRPVKGKTK